MKHFSVWSRSHLGPPLFANLVETGVGSGTWDFRSWSRPKKLRLRNTAHIRLFFASEEIVTSNECNQAAT